MLSCKHTARELSDLLDGQVPWWKRWLVRLHLGVCAPCRRSYQSLDRTVCLLGKLRDRPAPDPK